MVGGFGDAPVEELELDRRDEPAPVGEQVGALVVEERVPGELEVSPFDEDVRDPQREGAGGDRGQ